jgi:hypothetical protein
VSNSANTTNLPSYMTPVDDNTVMTDSDPSTNLPSFGVAIDDPGTYVDGLTLTQWTEQWYRWAVPSPGGPIDAFNDPNGTVAAALNQGFSPMYFITGAPPGVDRTFNVPLGKSVLVPIAEDPDSEGPNINPSIPGFVPSQGTYADEVKTVLADAQFTNGSFQLDGGKTVTNPPVIKSGIFDAGFAPAGSAGADFFGVTPGQGALLQTTGEEGYWVLLTGLSLGQHTLTASGTVSSPISGTFRLPSPTPSRLCCRPETLQRSWDFGT